ncbi:hypothetical protein D3C80_681540 [compost metagenome]
MVAGLLLNARRSSAVCRLPVMLTVALARVALSESASVNPLSMITGVETTLLPSLNAVVPPLVVTCGASLTAVTVTLAVSLATEKAPVPPDSAVSTLVPCCPAVRPDWSQAR